MDESAEQLFELSELDVEAVGLVRRGAICKPFFVIKSVGGNMSEPQKGQELSSVLQELEQAEGMTEALLEQVAEGFKALAQPQEPAETYADLSKTDKMSIAAFLKTMGKDKLGERTWAVLAGLAGDAEESSDDGNEDFAEALAEQEKRLTEEFTTKLQEERKARELVAEAFTAERRRRRLAEFTDAARSYDHLSVEIEQFAADLMAVADHDADLYSRVVLVLKAADEAIAQGGLFEQFSQGGDTDATGTNFEREVERVRVERFSDLQTDAGWMKAFDAVNREKPELARSYMREV